MSLQAFTSSFHFQDLYSSFTSLNLWIPSEMNSHGQHFIFSSLSFSFISGSDHLPTFPFNFLWSLWLCFL